MKFAFQVKDPAICNELIFRKPPKKLHSAAPGIGALAIADEEPNLSARILQESLQSLPKSVLEYGPDGGGKGGGTYWDYGSRYFVLLLCALETALGTDFGLSALDGFAPSGFYQLYMAGADRIAFDFGDCRPKRMSAPQHFWISAVSCLSRTGSAG